MPKESVTAVYYTGVGSRKVTHKQGYELHNTAIRLHRLGLCLRSGGATGADSYFEAGVDNNWCDSLSSNDNPSEIFVPYLGFGCKGYKITHLPSRYIPLSAIDESLVQKARSIARDVHPAWGKLTDAGRALHVRNIFQVLGRDLETPSSFLLCAAPYTDKKNGTPTGGTRTAWMIAKQHGIDCYNLTIPSHKIQFERFLEFFF